MRQEALRKAQEVDQEIKRGRLRGPLQGIPYGVKDLLSYAGQPTTWGARPYAGQVFDYNATVIDKLAGAGAVITGKLAMVELAGGGGYRYASASLTGPGLNPWDRTRWSGGSSSGSAAAVAAGLVTFAIGSETSGSIVTPASYCGVTALRPTYGLVSRHGAMALSWTLDKLGPFARSAEDCGLRAAGDCRQGRQRSRLGRQELLLHAAVRAPGQGAAHRLRARRFCANAPAAARPAFEAALGVLRAAGAQLVEIQWPQFPYGAGALHHPGRGAGFHLRAAHHLAARWTSWPTRRRSPA